MCSATRSASCSYLSLGAPTLSLGWIPNSLWHLGQPPPQGQSFSLRWTSNGCCGNPGWVSNIFLVAGWGFLWLRDAATSLLAFFVATVCAALMVSVPPRLFFFHWSDSPPY